MQPITVYRRDGRMKPLAVMAELLGGGVARIACPECGGTGWWDFAEPMEPGCDCVDCKGTGWRFVACWVSP